MRCTLGFLLQLPLENYESDKVTEQRQTANPVGRLDECDDANAQRDGLDPHAYARHGVVYLFQKILHIQVIHGAMRCVVPKHRFLSGFHESAVNSKQGCGAQDARGP